MRVSRDFHFISADYASEDAYHALPDKSMHSDIIQKEIYVNGAQPVEYLYDDHDRLIFSQDGNQRAQSTPVWTYYKYDNLNRLTEQGECTDKSDASSYKQQIRNYYDNYDFVGTSGFTDSRYVKDTSGYGKGSLTGSMVGGTGLCGRIYTAYYYDLRSCEVKRVESNEMSGYDVMEITYTFTNKPQTVTHTHSSSSKSLTEVTTYSYDHADRLGKVQHKLDGGATVTLAEYAYDNLGRLQSKKLGGTAHTATFAYNIRGWLTGITGSKFSQSLTYNNGTAGYNGNITSMSRTANGTSHGYTFTYDGLNRLTDAVHSVGRYTEKVTAYDKNGNIKNLQRYGQTGASAYGLIDNLTFTLNGNRLSRVDDAATASAYGNGFEFKDGAKQADEYAYDANGNLTKDLNAGVSKIQYNCLNLPLRIDFSAGGFAQYGYTMDGVKRRKQYMPESDSRNPVTIAYCGNVVYEESKACLLLTDEGYVTLEDGKYHYYLKDHQGNNCVVIDQSGTVEETNRYYPFGGVFASTGNVQPYKYNGKEVNARKELKWYDYGARHYDAALGRFHTNDRFAEKYYSMSPYQYGANNPIRNIDVNGDSIIVLNYTNGEHLALLVQNSSNRWEYYSFNGDKIYNSTEGSLGGGPQDNKGELSWSTPQAFFDSEYNQNTSKEDIESGKVNGYGYAEGYLIPTTGEQDGIIRETFLETVNQGYSLINNQCSMAVQKALNAAGIETKVSYNYSPMGAPAMYSSSAQYNPYLPSIAYRTIIKNNPNGIYIKRR